MTAGAYFSIGKVSTSIIPCSMKKNSLSVFIEILFPSCFPFSYEVYFQCLSSRMYPSYPCARVYIVVAHTGLPAALLSRRELSCCSEGKGAYASSSLIMNPPVTGTSLHTRLLAAASALLSRRKVSYLHPFHTLAGCGGRRRDAMSVGTFRSSYRPYPPPRIGRRGWREGWVSSSRGIVKSSRHPRCRAVG